MKPNQNNKNPSYQNLLKSIVKLLPSFLRNRNLLKQQSSLNYIIKKQFNIFTRGRMIKNEVGPSSSTNLENRMESLQSMYPDYSSPEIRCRICLEHNGELVQLPCACIGQIGLVHQKCFQSWVKSIRDEHHPLWSQGQRIMQTSQNEFQLQCEICKGSIKLEMVQKRQCIKCQEMKKTQIVIAILCIVFNIAIIIVISFLCISSIVNSANSETMSGVRIFINIFIMLIVFITLGWLIKRQGSRLIKTSIRFLKIKSQNRINLSQSQSKSIEQPMAEEEIKTNRSSERRRRRRRRKQDVVQI